MASIVYLLGTLVTLVCTVLLLRRYLQVKLRLLLWSGLCFAGLTVNNALVFADRILLPDDVSLYLWRLVIAAIAMCLLLVGLILDSE